MTGREHTSGIRCGADQCTRRAEVAVHYDDALIRLACLTDAIEFVTRALDADDPVRVTLLYDEQNRQLTIGPRGA
ncbi:hypothetical protein GCM10009613_61490 [Pseudonocardia kongjuensis]|uniref:Uncharacterized protein n=1 Tax=Pseudonocardia kongjuensis TaxID=102227 RepID=A0ABN1YB09_9PSEU